MNPKPAPDEASSAENLQQYTQILKSFGLALNNISLYTAKHRIAYMSLTQAAKELDDFLALKKELTLSFTEEAFLVENTPFELNNPLIENLKNQIKKWNIQSLTFQSGVSQEEILNFIEILIRRPEKGETDELKPLMVDKKITHITINKAIYVKSGEKGAKAAVRVKKAKKPIEVDPDKVEGFLMGLSKANAKVTAKIIETLEKDPDKLAKEVIESIQSKYEEESPKTKDFISEELASSLDRIGELLEKEAYKGKIKTREQLASLFQSLEKGIKVILEKGGEFEEKARKAFDQVQLRKCKIKVGIIASEYEKKRKSLDSLIDLAKNLLTDEDENRRILPLLKNKLLDGGMSEAAFRDMLEQIGLKSPRKEDRVKDAKESIEDYMMKILEGMESSETGKKEAVQAIMKRMEESVGHQIDLETHELLAENEVLKTRTDKTEAILKGVADAIVVVDHKGEVVFINPAAEELLGIKKEELVGEHILSKLKDTQMVTLSKDQLGDEGVFEPTEVEIRGTKDTVKTLRQSVGVIHNKNGHTVGTVSVLSDVSKQKELEQVKTDFVSNVSHELRTPLISIQKSIELVLSQQTGDINEDQKRFLEISNRNVARLMRLINDMLDISKLEAGKQDLHIQTVDVEKLTKEAIAGIQIWSQSKAIDLDTEIIEGIPNSLWDYDKVIQALTNFVSNAIKFTPEKGLITVSVFPVKGEEAFKQIRGTEIELKYFSENPNTVNDEFVAFSIHDSGPGMNQEDAVKIFDKFYQIQHTSGQSIQGTGLGLPIARQIVELHHGRLWVDSKKRAGATFTFALPVRDNSLIFA